MITQVSMFFFNNFAKQVQITITEKNVLIYVTKILECNQG